MPPGLKGYSEFYTKQGPEESSWGMRRDLRPGRSFGCMYFTADGMLILRHRTRLAMTTTASAAIAADIASMVAAPAVLADR